MKSKDSKLNKENSIGFEESNPIQNGLDIIDIPKEKIKECADFFKEFYSSEQKEREDQTYQNPKLMLEGSIFALGTKRLNNPEWKQHCATSIRELFTLHTSNYNKFKDKFEKLFLSKSQELNPSEEELLESFSTEIYGYFCHVDHHEIHDALMKIDCYFSESDDFTEVNCINDENFILMVNQFFEVLIKIIQVKESYQKNESS